MRAAAPLQLLQAAASVLVVPAACRAVMAFSQLRYALKLLDRHSDHWWPELKKWVAGPDIANQMMAQVSSSSRRAA